MEKLNKTLKNNEKAITLIALVITIIVLIILAGISITMLTGNNRYFTTSKKYKDKYNTCKCLRTNAIRSISLYTW